MTKLICPILGLEGKDLSFYLSGNDINSFKLSKYPKDEVKSKDAKLFAKASKISTLPLIMSIIGLIASLFLISLESNTGRITIISAVPLLLLQVLVLIFIIFIKINNHLKEKKSTVIYQSILKKKYNEFLNSIYTKYPSPELEEKISNLKQVYNERREKKFISKIFKTKENLGLQTSESSHNYYINPEYHKNTKFYIVGSIIIISLLLFIDLLKFFI
jgi:hypothetical protein